MLGNKYGTFGKHHFLSESVVFMGDESHRSRQTFKSISPSSFVDFMHMTRSVGSIGPSFHSYYAIYKTYDLFEQISTPDLVDVFLTLQKHHMRTPTGNPMVHMMAEKVVDRLHQDMDHLRPGDLDVLASTIPIEIPDAALKGKMRACVRQVMDKKSSFSLEDVLALALLVSNQKIWNKDIAGLLDSTLENALKDQPLKNNRLIKDVPVLLTENFSNQDMLLNIINVTVAKGLERKEEVMNRPIMPLVSAVYQLALQGRFDFDSIDKIIRDKGISRVFKHGRFIADRLKYGNEPRNIALRRWIVQINGLVQAMRPDYPGAKIDSRQENGVWLLLPTKYDNKKLTDVNNANKMVTTGQHIYSTLSEKLGGEDFVLETAIAPFFGTIDYLFILDSSSGKPVKIPQELRDLPVYSVSKVCPPNPNWIWHSICLCDASEYRAFLFRRESFSALSVLQKKSNLSKVFVTAPYIGRTDFFDVNELKKNVEKTVQMALATESTTLPDENGFTFQVVGSLGTSVIPSDSDIPDSPRRTQTVG